MMCRVRSSMLGNVTIGLQLQYMSPAARMMTSAGELVRTPNATRRMDDSMCVSESVCVHISVTFELLCCVFLGAQSDVCVRAHLSQRSHHQEPR